MHVCFVPLPSKPPFLFCLKKVEENQKMQNNRNGPPLAHDQRRTNYAPDFCSLNKINGMNEYIEEWV